MDSNITNEELNINTLAVKAEIGINTDELDPEVLQKLVDNNKELFENEISNIEHDAVAVDYNMENSINVNIKKTNVNNFISDIEEKE
jgi:hypothetical protein